MSYTYLTAQQLAEKIQYDARTIRNQLKDSVFIEGVHYIRPFGGRKILFVWERIETEMLKFTGLSIRRPRQRTMTHKAIGQAGQKYQGAVRA